MDVPLFAALRRIRERLLMRGYYLNRSFVGKVLGIDKPCVLRMRPRHPLQKLEDIWVKRATYHKLTHFTTFRAAQTVVYDKALPENRRLLYNVHTLNDPKKRRA